MVKLTLVYGHPSDPDAFERYYNEIHVPVYGANIPGMRKADLSKVVGTPDGGAPAYYRIADLWFDDVGAAASASWRRRQLARDFNKGSDPEGLTPFSFAN